jgi:hypothetical protein
MKPLPFVLVPVLLGGAFRLVFIYLGVTLILLFREFILKQKLNVALITAMSLLAPVAMAADESGAAAAMASIKAEAASLASAAWPIVTAIVVAGIGMKLFKKFANKST